jgi:hypothetical protein
MSESTTGYTALGESTQELLNRSFESALARRVIAWQAGFTVEEAKAAARGAKSPGAEGIPSSLNGLIALSLERRGSDPRYPKWQFEPAVLRYLSVIIKALPNLTTWNIYDFFTDTNALLGTSPLDALRRGQHQQTLQAAIAANIDY